MKKGSFLLDSTPPNIPVFFHLSILYDMPPNRDFSRGHTPRIKGFYPPHERDNGKESIRHKKGRDEKSSCKKGHDEKNSCQEGHYDNTLFHRVISYFMIQGGGMKPGMEEKSTHEPIKNEANNGVSNAMGTIAMARTGDPHSASAQFFINVADNLSLNYSAPTPGGWGYCVFGMVSEGMDVVDSIREVPVTSIPGYDDVPEKDVIIKGVTVAQ